MGSASGDEVLWGATRLLIVAIGDVVLPGAVMCKGGLTGSQSDCDPHTWALGSAEGHERSHNGRGVAVVKVEASPGRELHMAAY